MERGTLISHLKAAFNFTLSNYCNCNCRHWASGFSSLLSMQTSDGSKVYIIHKSDPRWLIYHDIGQKDNARTLATSKKVSFVIFRQWGQPFLQTVAQTWHHDLASVSGTFAVQVLFLSARTSSASQSNDCVSLLQLLRNLRWWGCGAEWKAAGESSVLCVSRPLLWFVWVFFFFFSVIAASVPAGWCLEKQKAAAERLLIFIITDTAVAEAGTCSPKSQDTIYILQVLSGWVINCKLSNLSLFFLSLSLSSRSSSWCSLSDRCSFT